MKNYLICLLLSVTNYGYCQINSSDTATHQLTLLFAGDIMGHDPQIKAAYNSKSKDYNYESVFKYVRPLISGADFAVANLEVTLAGPPFKGYPQFSSPDELALASKEAGFDMLVTSNNHSVDRGDNGIIRTINVLDSVKLLHTGTFKDSNDYLNNNPLIIEQNCIRIAFLNYTYGTNGLNNHYPTIVNRLDTALIRKDIKLAKSKNVDKIVVVTHWGQEYKPQPVKSQVEMGSFILNEGADIIIGSHPHVLEKMIWEKQRDTIGQDQIIVYSLGNFVSNQRARYKDGGAMFELTFEKQGGQTLIKKAGYHLTWVYTPYESGVKKYYILPAAQYENQPEFFDNIESYHKMKLFLNDSRSLFNQYNLNVNEVLNNKN